MSMKISTESVAVVSDRGNAVYKDDKCCCVCLYALSVHTLLLCSKHYCETKQKEDLP